MLLKFLQSISPSQFIQQINQQHDPQLIPIWLNNAGKTVVGLLPKVSWCVYPSTNQGQFQVVQQQENTKTTSQQTYQQFVDHLIAYSQNQAKICQILPKKEAYYQGLMGFVGYDVAAQHLTDQVCGKLQQPCAYLGHYDVYLTCQSSKTGYQWQLHGEANLEKQQTILDVLQTINWQTNIEILPLSFNACWQFEDYQQAFAKTQDYLQAGDCYQINLTQAWQGMLMPSQKLSHYLPMLMDQTHAPFATFLAVEDFELLSCSPELFVSFEKNSQNEWVVMTKPIKGTKPRGKTPDEDLQLKQQLANSEKDLAENVMIVDLLRNDLGKYAKAGTVSVPKRFVVESFSHVHHLVSTIQATLQHHVHPLQLLFDSLPAGSITGTPKKRAVEIIDELEFTARGAYCGTMGYLNFDGTGQWNVLIRTLQAYQQQVKLWAGGGITIASDCQAEYQECFDKVGFFLGLNRGREK